MAKVRGKGKGAGGGCGGNRRKKSTRGKIRKSKKRAPSSFLLYFMEMYRKYGGDLICVAKTAAKRWNSGKVDKAKYKAQYCKLCKKCKSCLPRTKKAKKSKAKKSSRSCPKPKKKPSC